MTADPADKQPYDRLASLLKPVKDVAQSWNIDVAAELDHYLSSLEKTTENSSDAPNFAEAALLLQTTTSLYSRKVEHLRMLAYQTLGSISKKKESHSERTRAGKNKNWDDQSFFGVPWHAVASSADGASLISVQRPLHSVTLLERMPLLLVPREDAGDSKLSSFHLTSSGLLLASEDDEPLLSVGNMGGCNGSLIRVGSINTPLIHDYHQTGTPKPWEADRAINQSISRLGSTNRGNEDTRSRSHRLGAVYEGDEEQCMEADDTYDMEKDASVPIMTKQSVINDTHMWMELDEHAPQGKDKPYKAATKMGSAPGPKFRCDIRSVESKQLDLFRVGEMDWMLWANGNDEIKSVPGYDDIKLPRPLGIRLGLDTSFIEYDDLISLKQKEMKQLKSMMSRKQSVISDVYRAIDTDTDNDGVDDDNSPYMSDGGDAAIDVQMNESVEGSVVRNQKDEIEAALLKAQKSYADVYSEHLSAHNDLNNLPHEEQQIYELRKRVAEWRTRVESWMKELQDQPPFNVSAYKNMVASRFENRHVLMLPDKAQHGIVDGCMDFSDIAKGMTRHDICRTFLTTLMLVNQKRLEIIEDPKR
eukprot:GHVO01053680.1.p1 GENE.GHVO01053680.1~~GHVO01053680.1.p1  ORF type:complete len:588 (+),score=111.95 GHVO01053680.1:37-1800(+)